MADDDKVISMEKARKKRPAPLSNRDAQALINRLAKNSALVFIPDDEHAAKQSGFREFVREEVIEILQEGIIREEPRWLGNAWAYRLEYPRFRGRPFGAAVAVIIREKETGKNIYMQSL